MDTALQMLTEYANTKGNLYKKAFTEDIIGLLNALLLRSSLFL